MATITVGINSYTSLSDADDYFDTRLNSDVWDSTDAEEKIKALITATKRIDKNIFIGIKQTVSQTLEFPRYVTSYTNPESYSLTNNSNSLLLNTPQDVLDATCEEALALLSIGKSTHIRNQKMGIKSISMGNESVSYANDVSSNKLLSVEADALVQKWLKKGFNFAVYR